MLNLAIVSAWFYEHPYCTNSDILFRFLLNVHLDDLIKRAGLWLWSRRNPPLLKLHFSLPPGFAFESGVPEDVLVDNGFVQGNIHRVSEGKDKGEHGRGLNAGPFSQGHIQGKCLDRKYTDLTLCSLKLKAQTATKHCLHQQLHVVENNIILNPSLSRPWIKNTFNIKCKQERWQPHQNLPEGSTRFESSDTSFFPVLTTNYFVHTLSKPWTNKKT